MGNVWLWHPHHPYWAPVKAFITYMVWVKKPLIKFTCDQILSIFFKVTPALWPWGSTLIYCSQDTVSCIKTGVNLYIFSLTPPIQRIFFNLSGAIKSKINWNCQAHNKFWKFTRSVNENECIYYCFIQMTVVITEACLLTAWWTHAFSSDLVN